MSYDLHRKLVLIKATFHVFQNGMANSPHAAIVRELEPRGS